MILGPQLMDGMMFTTLSLGCVKNVMIIRDGCGVTSVLVMNYGYNVLLILRS